MTRPDATGESGADTSADPGADASAVPGCGPGRRAGSTVPRDRPIGVFDSGFGGLTVARAIIDLLPGEDVVYIGDTGRYPYGNKDLAEVRTFARELAGSLVDDHGAKVVVVACNTAAAALPIDELAAELPVPVIGVIDPGASALVRATRSGRVGVIGTVGTVASGTYERSVAAMAGTSSTGSATGSSTGSSTGSATGDGIRLTTAACPGFVEFVERGQTDGAEVEVLAERLLAPVVAAGIDTLLLGCTHYPYLARVIGRVMGPDVVLVSSADETAFALRTLLLEHDLLSGRDRGRATHRFLSSGDPRWFADLGRRLLGPELEEADVWIPGSAPSRD